MMRENKTFFFYDLETSGLNPRADRVMQFAGQRTTLELEPIGEPVNVLVKMTDDALPSPLAIRVTKITPQQTLSDGMSEKQFADYVQEDVFGPGTIVVGYNNVRFDDEFMRSFFWRNFYDPYEWEWKEGRSRWDLLDVVRLTRALRPEGIKWPVSEDGRSTNRLELLTKINGLEHAHAHDALSDVYATIAVARLIFEKQPELFKFMFKMREKNEIKKYVNLENKRPFVYASGRYDVAHEKTTVAFPLTSARNGNILVFDLRYNLEEELSRRGIRVEEVEKDTLFPIVKELSYGRCPAVAPLGVMEKAGGWDKIGLTPERLNENLQALLRHPEFAELMRGMAEMKPDYPEVTEPEEALYDGFLGNRDRIKVAAVRNADADKLADFHPDFDDERLPELLLHYKGRNFPSALSEAERERWESYRRKRLAEQSAKFLGELEQIKQDDEFLAEELRLYFESLAYADY